MRGRSPKNKGRNPPRRIVAALAWRVSAALHQKLKRATMVPLRPCKKGALLAEFALPGVKYALITPNPPVIIPN